VKPTAALPSLVLLLLVLTHTNVFSANITLIEGGDVYLSYVDVTSVFGQTERYNTMSIISPPVHVVETGCQTYHSGGGTRLVSNLPSSAGCKVRLGHFSAGTVFVFELCASNDPDGSCAEVFSSDPTLNPNNEEHAAIYSFPGTYDPALGYGSPETHLIAWSDNGDVYHDPTPGLEVYLQVVRDSDGDGIWDNDEFGIDTNGDQFVDISPFDLGARPWKHDVFVHIDYMDCNQPGSDCAPGDRHSHRPKQAALDAVQRAFLNAPVDNPREGPGIAVHVEIGRPIPHHMVTDFKGPDGTVPAGSIAFDALKDAFFPPTDPRRWIYHYCLFVHQMTGPFGGRGEQPGDDFFVALGASCPGCGDIDGDGLIDANVGSVAQQATTLMHELGHNLGLGHGGGDATNNKPNYLSIMNYDFFWGIPPVDPDGSGPLRFRLDYSRSALQTIDENALLEARGIGDGSDNTYYHCVSGASVVAPGSGPIDWNCDGVVSTNPVVANINGDCPNAAAGGACQPGDPAIFSSLAGYEDWDNLHFEFRSAADFPGGLHLSAPLEPSGSDAGPPIADAGADRTVECQGPMGAPVELRAGDQNLPSVTYAWYNENGVLVASTQVAHLSVPIGAHVYTLSVRNSRGVQEDQVKIEVVDTTPPTIVCAADTTIESTSRGGIPRMDSSVAGVIVSTIASDACDSAPALTNSAPDVLPVGITAVHFTVRDESGNTANCDTRIQVAQMLAVGTLRGRDGDDDDDDDSKTRKADGAVLMRIPNTRLGAAEVIGRLGGHVRDLDAFAVLHDLSGDRGFAIDGKHLIEIDLDTGSARRVCVIGRDDVVSMTFEPSVPSLLAITDEGRLLRIDVITGRTTTLVKHLLRGHEPQEIAFHPAGRAFVLARGGRLYQIDPSGGAIQRAWRLSGPTELRGLLWSLYGERIYSTMRHKHRTRLVAIDLGTATVRPYSSERTGPEAIGALAWRMNVSAASHQLAAESTTSEASGTSKATGTVIFQLHPVIPNPFRTSAQIRFALPLRTSVELGVFDVTGRRVATLQSGVLDAGQHVVGWTGLSDMGTSLSPGLYVVRLVAGNVALTRKAVLTH
jgi:hypothetical protein